MGNMLDNTTEANKRVGELLWL